jgi:hypothetical protein
MSLVFDSYPTGGGERLLALALADCANDNGENIFPSVSYLVRATAQSERSVRYQLKAMCTAAENAPPWLLVAGRRACPNGYVQVYRINPEWIATAAANKAQRLAERAARFRANRLVPDDEKPVAIDAPTGATIAPVTPDEDPPRVQPLHPTGATIAPDGCNHCTQNHHITIKEPKTRSTGDKPPVTPPDPEDLKLAEFLLGLIRERIPDHRDPNWGEWCTDIRRMRERDGRTRHDIAALFRWASGHEFWHRNILSPAKLRKQWDRLKLDRNAEMAKAVTGNKPAGPPVGHVGPPDRRCVGAGPLLGQCQRSGVTSIGLAMGAKWYCRECNRERERLEADAEHA